MDRQTHGMTGNWKDGLTKGLTDRQTEGWADGLKDGHTDGQLDRRTKEWTDGQNGGQTDRQTDGRMHGKSSYSTGLCPLLRPLPCSPKKQGGKAGQ